MRLSFNRILCVGYILVYKKSFDLENPYFDVYRGQGVGGGGAVQHGVVQVAENVLQEEHKQE